MSIVKRIDNWIDSGGDENIPDKAVDNIEMVTALSIIKYFNDKKRGVMNGEKNRKCLTEEDIAAFVDKKEAFTKYAQVLEHLVHCSKCRKDVDDVREFLNIEEARVPLGLAEKAFGEAGKSKTREKNKIIQLKRFALPAAVAASILLVCGLVIFLVTNPSPSSDLYTAHVSDNNVHIINMAQEENLMIKKAAMQSLGGVKSLLPGISKDKKIQSEIHHDKTITHAGYIYFIIKYSRNDHELLKGNFSKMIAPAADPSEAMLLIEQKKFEAFEKMIERSSDGDKKLFNSGYLLGLLFYSDSNGSLDRKMIDLGVKYLSDSTIKEVRDYMLALKSGSVKKRKDLRDLILQEVFENSI